MTDRWRRIARGGVRGGVCGWYMSHMKEMRPNIMIQVGTKKRSLEDRGFVLLFAIGSGISNADGDASLYIMFRTDVSAETYETTNL